MRIDFDAKDTINDYTSVPEGTYVCRIAETRTGTTRAGDERWSMRLVVAEGQHVGKQAAWDSLVFSSRGRARARAVLHALGMPSSGKVDLEPADLEGKAALVTVRPGEYESPSGLVVRRNEVPYDGYRTLPGDREDADSAGDPHTAGESGAHGRSGAASSGGVRAGESPDKMVDEGGLGPIPF